LTRIAVAGKTEVNKVCDPACWEHVIIMLKDENAVTNRVSDRVSELPQSTKFEKLKE
jgi:hypothetical protein